MSSTETSSAAASCPPKRRGGGTVSLPVLATGSRARNAWSADHPVIAHSRAGRWRAAALVLVHVLIAAHIVQWYITGMTLSPVEPSESMQTLREGVVNAGFVFFALTILSTAIFGRFFCGWACHIVALQDLCSWIMTKVRVKPKPFRSRLLVWVPLLLALYMFVWPVVHREVVRPIFADERGRLPFWLGQSEPLPGVTVEFFVEDFWATFAPWYIAIPFIFVCTFGAVYFLGSKGFCTYGCPYGGFFGPADRIAPGRIRVTDACEHCGHCTAVCTSNVRVHEEVRDYGMVVDPGCMKCLDCVSVCPNDALYVGFGAPAAFAKVRPGAEESAAKAGALREQRYDLTRKEELAVGLLFLALFMGYRGMFNQVPMLMAVGMGGIAAFCAWKLWCVLRDPSVRLQSLQLKVKGRATAFGWIFALATIAMLAVAAWSGWVRHRLWRAEMSYARMETPIAVVMRPDFEPTREDIASARSALADYAAAGPRSAGGWGWSLRPEELTNVAYMRLLLGETSAAEAALREVIERGRPTDALIQQTVRVMAARGATQDEMRQLLREALARHAHLDQTREQIAREMMQRGDRDAAVALWEKGLTDNPRSAATRFAAAAFFAELNGPNDADRARQLLDERLAMAHRKPDLLMSAAALAARLGDRARAVELAASAAERSRGNAQQRVGAAGVLAQLGESEKALMQALRGVETSRRRGRHSGQPGLLLQSAMLHMSAGKMDEGMKLVKEAAAALGGVGVAPWEQAGMGVTLVNAGGQAGNKPLLDQGLKLLEMARDGAPEAPTIRHDLAVAYGFAGDLDGAERELRRAAELAPRSAMLADRLAQLLRERGKLDESDRWKQEAQRRSGGGRPGG